MRKLPREPFQIIDAVVFINIFKYQPAGYGGSFGQPRPDNVAKHKGPPAAGTEKFKTAVAQLIIVVRQRAYRDQPLGAETFHRGKDARRSQSGNFDVKSLPSAGCI